MNTLLTETLNTIEKEAGDFHLSYTLVDRIIAEYGEADIANKLYSDIPSETNWQVVADLFGILIWSTTDNGAELTKTTEGWLLEANDIRKASVAMNLDVYPFKDESKMVSTLTLLIERWPELNEMCSNLLISRRNKNA